MHVYELSMCNVLQNMFVSDIRLSVLLNNVLFYIICIYICKLQNNYRYDDVTVNSLFNFKLEKWTGNDGLYQCLQVNYFRNWNSDFCANWFNICLYDDIWTKINTQLKYLPGNEQINCVCKLLFSPIIVQYK